MQYHGAKWWKFDFHSHTPISMDYGKGPNQEVLQQRTPREWLFDHMLKEIDCVAITDHNSGDWIDTLKAELILMRQEKVENFRELTIFPGVEITVHGNIHVLAIFAPSEDSRYISNVLSRCLYTGTPGESDDCTNKSFNEVVDIIHEMKGLAIPAHVDAIRGLFKEEEGNSLRKCLNAAGLLAIQLCDSTYSKPQIYQELKFNLTEIAGSDSHHPENVGSSFTWVKMEEPNLEALRLALHDGDDGTKRSDSTTNNPNEVQNRFFIKSIEIINGAKAGRANPLKVNLSPWLNTIIGGRGSGKSSLIEYMRFPLGKTTTLPKKIIDEFKEFNQVPKERGKAGMLTPSTKIRVEMQKDGRNIALTWQDNKIIEEQKNEEDAWEQKDESSNSNIDSRFPVRIFSQKHLYSLTEDPNHILTIVDEQFDKKSWIQTKEELHKKWMQSRSKQREVTLRINAKGNLNTELDDVNAKMKIYEDSGHKTLLEEYQRTQVINDKLNQEIKDIENFHINIKTVLSEAPEDIFTSGEFSTLDQVSLEKLENRAEQFEHITKQVNDLLADIDRFKTETKQIVDQIPWQSQKIIHEQKYNEFVKRLESSGEKNPNAYSQLVTKQRELEQKLSEFTTLEDQLKLQREESNRIYQEIESHEQNLRTQRVATIENWQSNNPNIKMYLKVMGDTLNAETTFRSIIRKSGKEFSKDVLEFDDDEKAKNGILFELMESSAPWEKRQEIVRKILDADERDSKNFGKLFVNHLVGLKNKTPEDIDRLIVWYPEDKITLKLVNANKKEEDIETGSAGQRTAAMLSLMLLLDDTPLIIDQPEEDLDTKRITDLVVKGLRNFKTKQQVIIITHNPNIPVNGAAENIILMNFAGGQIQKHISGALQKKNIREAICEVMEGGKDALDKRYFRISKALE